MTAPELSQHEIVLLIEQTRAALLGDFQPTGRADPPTGSCPPRSAARQAYERSRWATALRDSREARRARAAEWDCMMDTLAVHGSAHEMLACRRD